MTPKHFRISDSEARAFRLALRTAVRLMDVEADRDEDSKHLPDMAEHMAEHSELLDDLRERLGEAEPVT